MLLLPQTTRTSSGSKQGFFFFFFLKSSCGGWTVDDYTITAGLHHFSLSFLFSNVGKFPLSSNSFLYPHKHAFHFISKIDSQFERKSERATLIATCFMTITFFLLFFYMGNGRGEGIKLALFCVLMCGGYLGLVHDYGGLLRL
ncbi:hypothetical protein TRIATDRAFT_297841 [Trichoderma atroviride IMI 206040]|uniref:Uncharacterized protein n=1 Tax=Hypocrea atroviridis (strain ATCC 20476 / IMI 206040) TaxID=452589 RepID=G9NJV9_HYPAI|nr:uncharacterized protein TRIATDRAFT_297841 [Trichoderma atroviride IMI 206040]EHK49180.1 hypothetical protein TRIATDRAFT_297841 [Trichoderma atroviride IMI 206040]